MTPFAIIVKWAGRAPAATDVEPLLGPVAARCGDGTRSAAVTGAAAAVGLRAIVAEDSLDGGILVDRQRQLLAVGDVRLYDRALVEARLGAEARARGLTDVALVALAYEHLGPDAAASLVGDFAVVVWDWGRRRLWAARDHFGLRSLHYRLVPNGIALATDVRQLLALAPEDREIDPDMALDYLTGAYAHHGRSFFRRIRQISPAHHLTAGDGWLGEQGYWRPPVATRRSGDYRELVEEWQAVFRASVRARLESRFPIAAHLSGGLDSGSIVGAAHEIYAAAAPGARPPLTTLSAVFPGLDCDESPYIDAVLRRVSAFEAVRWDGTALCSTDLVDPTLAIPGLRRGPGGGPHADIEAARARGARVMLTGTGGDDVGWARGVFRDVVGRGRLLTLAREVRAGAWPRIGKFVRDGIKRGLLPPALLAAVRGSWPGRQHPPPWIGPTLAALFPGAPDDRDSNGLEFSSHVQREVWRALNAPQAAICVDMLALLGADAGLETRMPYLDVRLSDLVLSVPWTERLPHGDMRRLQRDGVAAFLPTVVAGRMDKASFATALARQVKASQPAFAEMFNGAEWVSGGFVSQEYARRALSDLAREDPGLRKWWAWIELWRLASFEAWLRAVLAYDPRQRTPMSHSETDNKGSTAAPLASAEPQETVTAKLAYERPILIPIGSARDLLAGGAGTQPDAEPPPATFA
jgi:asparagine synthase (glutamine-hydrolysing)